MACPAPSGWALASRQRLGTPAHGLGRHAVPQRLRSHPRVAHASAASVWPRRQWPRPAGDQSRGAGGGTAKRCDTRRLRGASGARLPSSGGSHLPWRRVGEGIPCTACRGLPRRGVGGGPAVRCLPRGGGGGAAALRSRCAHATGIVLGAHSGRVVSGAGLGPLAVRVVAGGRVCGGRGVGGTCWRGSGARRRLTSHWSRRQQPPLVPRSGCWRGSPRAFGPLCVGSNLDTQPEVG